MKKEETKTEKRGEDIRAEIRERKRELLDLRGIANAAEHLDHLPEPGCSIHAIMRGNYSYSDIIPAVLRLAAPARLTYLAVVTLGFSNRAAKLILRLIDSGQVVAVDFVCADFFEKADAEVCSHLRGELRNRGSRFASARCHAKILLFETDDGRNYVSESSANIRACRSIEQFALFHDRELFEFHRRWIQEVIAEHGAKKEG